MEEKLVNILNEMAEVLKEFPLLETEVNGLKVNLFEYDIESEESISQIKEYLINKVKISKVHNTAEYDLTYYGAQNLDPEFVARFNEQVAKINIPKKSAIPQFDVRRERVTEWMAQYLLEQEYGCIFYDEADKRINLKAVEIDKHTDGIDVPGIWIDNDKIRFVVCEVKASEETKIPCNSSQGLQEDIQKAIDNADNRVTREILEYMHGIRNIKIQDGCNNFCSYCIIPFMRGKCRSKDFNLIIKEAKELVDFEPDRFAGGDGTKEKPYALLLPAIFMARWFRGIMLQMRKV